MPITTPSGSILPAATSGPAKRSRSTIGCSRLKNELGLRWDRSSVHRLAESGSARAFSVAERSDRPKHAGGRHAKTHSQPAAQAIFKRMKEIKAKIENPRLTIEAVDLLRKERADLEKQIMNDRNNV